MKRKKGSKETNVTADSAQEQPHNTIQIEQIHPPEKEVDSHENQDEVNQECQRKYKCKPYHLIDNLLTNNSFILTKFLCFLCFLFSQSNISG